VRLNLSAFLSGYRWKPAKQIYFERYCGFDNYIHELQLKVKLLLNNSPDMLGRHSKSTSARWSGHLSWSLKSAASYSYGIRLIPGRVSIISSKRHTNSRRRLKLPLSMSFSICVKKFRQLLPFSNKALGLFSSQICCVVLLVASHVLRRVEKSS